MSLETKLAEDRNLKQLGIIKSSYGLIDLAASQIENRLLLQDEIANDSPASFMNIFLENFGRLGSQSFYEQMMYKNEMLPSTAIKLRSLVNKLSSKDIGKIYAYPARMTFVLGYEYDRLVDLATKNPDNSIIINKECKFNMDGQEIFVLDHNIQVRVTNPFTTNQNIYAIYDTSDRLDPDNSFSEVNNIYINSQVFYYNNIKIFGMFINTRQLERKETIINITNENPDFQLFFKDQLYGFELGHKTLTGKTYQFKPGMFEGNIVPGGYNYNIDPEERTIDFSFNRSPSYWKPTLGDSIKVIIYTTKGSRGNFKIPNIYDQFKQTHFEYVQNRDVIQENSISYTNPYVSIKDSGAVGGKDALSFDEIRALVINRGSHNKILTPGDLEKKGAQFDFSVKKTRSDVMKLLEYRASGILHSGENIISSIDTTMTFNFDEIPINNEVSSRIISPRTIYEKNNESGYCILKKNPEPFETYFDQFKNNYKNQYMFPYHIKFTSNKNLEAQVFNMNRDNDIYNLNFKFFNNNTAFESSILNIIVNRDPINEDITKIPDYKPSSLATGYYDITFQVKTSSTVIQNLLHNPDNPIIKYRIGIEDPETENRFMVKTYINPDEIDIADNTLIVHGYIKTDDAISNTGRMITRDYSIEPIPFVANPIEYYFISKKVQMNIYVLEKNLNGISITTPQDIILTESEKSDLYFVSTIYEAKDVILYEDYSDYITLPSDIIVKQKEYKRYTETVYRTHKDTKYVTNSDGSIKTELKRFIVNNELIEVTNNVILYEKGSFVYKDKQELSLEEIYIPIQKLTGKTKEELQQLDTLTIYNMITFDIGLLEIEALVTYLNAFLELTGKKAYRVYTDDDKKFIVLNDGETNKLTVTYLNDSVRALLQTKLNSYRKKEILYNEGDIINDGTSVLRDETYTAIIKHLPVFNRIYAIGSGYKDILHSYEKLISNLKALQSLAPDGASLSLGIRNTAGRGDYEIYNLKTNSWQPVDNIALSFSIGVKFIDNIINNEEFDFKVISDTIRDFVNNFNEISFSINTIFDIIKKKVPSIEYLVLIRFNQYPPDEVQSIRKKNGKDIISDKLSVRQIIDMEQTDLKNNLIFFKPDIKIQKIQ